MRTVSRASEAPVPRPGPAVSVVRRLTGRRPRARSASPGGVEGGRRRHGRGADDRRAVEAELIGLPTVDGPSWWTACWEHGAADDLAADRLFDALGELHPEVRVLHDLRVSGTSAAIDHVLIGPGGVVVADTESCPGRVRTDGVHLRVRGRDRSPVVDLALWQAEVVRGELARRGLGDVPVHGVLHWRPLRGLGTRAICLRGVPLLSAGAAMGLARNGVRVSPWAVERIEAVLAPDRQRAA